MHSVAISAIVGFLMVALLGVTVSMYTAAGICLAFVFGLMYLAWKDYLGAVIFLLAWGAFLSFVWNF